MNSFKHLKRCPFSFDRLMLIIISCSIIGTGCSSSGARVEDQLRTRFQEMKVAVEQGDLRTLQEIWVSPTGGTYSMEKISKYYAQRGKGLADSIRGAKLAKSPNVFVPSGDIRKRHPEAKYAGILRVRNSYGDAKAIHAIKVDDSWRMIHPIRLQQESQENDSGEKTK